MSDNSDNHLSTAEDLNDMSDATSQVVSKNNPSTAEDQQNAVSDVIPRVASKRSVEKALEFIRRRRNQKLLKRKGTLETDLEYKIVANCITSLTAPLTRVNVGSAFVRTFIPIEIRNALLNEEWPSVLKLFLMLLKSEKGEPLVWRYAFLIYLRCPASDQYTFEDFITMCRGTDPSNYSTLLEKLLSLSKTTEENT
ncbi:uncharacterized protein LOC123267021 [Cotesia glomerata]|uniref:Uncharacterized protein n=1 Tax=Cotesia glomerata TaxID=32391 RepID=A0AAV7HS02_COTGL|nr:uncharacterized protein LOC123267021 [Cotesia glomerata]KAH0534840.1 hypothetical protein KQX54_009201 [Cotesia glomerata]